MHFPFKLFWRLMPYVAYMTLIFQHYERPMTPAIGLVVILTLSFYKAASTSWFFLTFSLLETVFLLAYAWFIPSFLALWIVVPLLDWLMKKQPSESRRWLPVILLTVATMVIMKSHLDLHNINTPWQWIWQVLLMISMLWTGQTIYTLENKKDKAQGYYDQLRESEDALKKANQDLQDYYETLEEVTTLRERTRLSREIHDHVGHALSTTLIQLQAISLKLSKEGSDSTGALERLTHYIRETLSSTREVVHNMAPAPKGSKKLNHELATLCSNVQAMTGTKVLFTHSQTELALTDDQIQNLYRITQEALTNAIKHGEAKHIKVIASAHDTHLTLTISDDGLGADGIYEQFGLTSIKARTLRLNGTIHYDTKPGEGFLVRINIPKEAPL